MYINLNCFVGTTDSFSVRYVFPIDAILPLAVIEGPLGRAHRRPSIFDRQVWVAISEEEHVIGNRRLLEALQEAEDVLSRFG